MCSNTPPPVIMAQPDCSFVAFSSRALLKYILDKKNYGGKNDYGRECSFFFEVGLIKIDTRKWNTRRDNWTSVRQLLLLCPLSDEDNKDSFGVKNQV